MKTRKWTPEMKEAQSKLIKSKLAEKKTKRAYTKRATPAQSVFAQLHGKKVTITYDKGVAIAHDGKRVYVLGIEQ